MSRRSLQKEKTRRQLRRVGKIAAKEFESTRPHHTVKGTGKWLKKGEGVGEVVTLPEKERE